MPSLLLVNEKLLECMVIILLFVVSLQNQEDVAEAVGIEFSTRAYTKLFVVMIVFFAVDVVVVVTHSTILHVSYQV